MDQMNIKRDARVHTAHGDFGKVKHVILDRDTREVTDLVVDVDGDEYLVPMTAVDRASGDELMLSGTPADYHGMRFEHDGYRTVDHDRARVESSGEARHGGAPLLDADEDAVAVTEATGRTGTAAMPGYMRGAEPVSHSEQDYRLEAWETYADEGVCPAPGVENTPAYPSSLREGPLPDMAAPAGGPSEMMPDYRPDSPMPQDMTPEDTKPRLP